MDGILKLLVRRVAERQVHVYIFQPPPEFGVEMVGGVKNTIK